MMLGADLTRREMPPSMACVQARYPRRPTHGRPRFSPCPTRPPGRAHPGAPTTGGFSWTAARLLRWAVSKGTRDHDRQALAQSGRAARRARREHPGNVLLAGVALRERPLSLPAHLRAQTACPARDVARKDRLPGTPLGGVAQAVGEIGTGGGAGLDRASRQGRSVAQEGSGSRCGATFLRRHRGWMDQERLARVGIWLEAAPGHHRRWRVDTPSRSTHPGQHFRQPGGSAADRGAARRGALRLGGHSLQRPKRARGLLGKREVSGGQWAKRTLPADRRRGGDYVYLLTPPPPSDRELQRAFQG